MLMVKVKRLPALVAQCTRALDEAAADRKSPRENSESWFQSETIGAAVEHAQATRFADRNDTFCSLIIHLFCHVLRVILLMQFRML